MKKLQKYFDDQKEYICCHQGCAKCCRRAQFPYTEIEFKLICEGLSSLEPKLRKRIFGKIKNLNAKKQKFLEENPDKKFIYNCPFLVNNECSVYYYRGLVCRAFGLMTFKLNSSELPGIPFCAYKGLNYSKVLDKKTNNISLEKFEKYKFKNEPLAFNVDYKTLINDEIGQGFGFEFGDVKPLIDWFKDMEECPAGTPNR